MGSAKKKNGESVNTTHFLQAALLNAVINSFNGNYWWKDIHGVYRECNQKLIALLGLASANDLVGKTDYELPWKKNADQLMANDNLVISRKEALSYEERAIDAKGKEHIFQVTKAPVFDENNEVIGTVGTSIDITAQKEVEKLTLENERQQITLQEKEKFAQLARKVAHDISSPLGALGTMIRLCDGVPEDQRIALARATESITDIANNLLRNFRQQKNEQVTATSEVEPRQPLLVSDLLIELLSEKKAEYSNSQVRFNTIILDDAQFAFIQCQPIEFRRALSNLINNAVDALEGKADGVVTIHTLTYENRVVIEVADNGCGMPGMMVGRMQRRQSFTSGKENGHGLGLQQVWDTLDYNEGAMDVQSKPRQGTTIKLAFVMVAAANWIAQEIHLTPHSIIVILDDDESIHAAWNLRFSSFVTANPTLRLQHFTQGQEVLDFLATLSQEERDHVVFLSDYELLHQDRNGLQIIEASEIKGATLVTSYYSNQKIREEAGRLGVRVLPKRMASVIPVNMN